MRYKNGILLDKLILYLHKLIITINRNNLISNPEVLVWPFPAFNAYGNSLKPLVMRSFQYLQCRMRSYCCYLVIFRYNHIRGEYAGYLKVSETWAVKSARYGIPLLVIVLYSKIGFIGVKILISIE